MKGRNRKLSMSSKIPISLDSLCFNVYSTKNKTVNLYYSIFIRQKEGLGDII